MYTLPEKSSFPFVSDYFNLTSICYVAQILELAQDFIKLFPSSMPYDLLIGG